MATVRIVTINGSATVRTVIDSDSQQNARQLLTHMYGRSNVFSVQQMTHEDVTEEAKTKTQSPAELQVKSLADQAKRLNQQAKLKSGQLKVQKAQERLRVASEAPKLSVKRT